MKREIKIIKRGVRNQVELEQVLKAEVASALQLARTIEEWIRIRRQRASEELLAARAFRTAV